VPGMVETFEKSYAGLKIAYPGDQGRLAEIDAQAAEQKKRFHGYVGSVLNGAQRKLRIHRRLQYLFSRYQYSGLRGPYLSDLLEVKLGLLLWISNFFLESVSGISPF
jgi:hypothetical protein